MNQNVFSSTVQTAQQLHQSDRSLIEQHEEYILRLASSNKDPVTISIYLQKHGIDIRISALRSFFATQTSP